LEVSAFNALFASILQKECELLQKNRKKYEKMTFFAKKSCCSVKNDYLCALNNLINALWLSTQND